jgi:hypothetical protein
MKRAMSLIGLPMTLAIPSGLLAQQAGYSQTSLVSNTARSTGKTEPSAVSLLRQPATQGCGIHR